MAARPVPSGAAKRARDTDKWAAAIAAVVAEAPPLSPRQAEDLRRILNAPTHKEVAA